MGVSISIDLTQPLWEDVPEKVRSEGKHLAGILKRIFDTPADVADVRIAINLYLEGRKPSQIPFGSTKVRLDKPIKNIAGARISIGKSEWSMSVATFRQCLWDLVEKALKGCLATLENRGTTLEIDEGFLRDLAQAKAEFLPQGLSSTEPRGTQAVLAVQHEEPDDKRRLIIQYRIRDHGDAHDLDKRHEIEELLGQFLQRADLGFCDGGDIGSGTMNIFCFVKPKRGVGTKIIEVLRMNNRLEGAVVAETVDEGEEQVTWPPDFKGEFQLIYR